MDMKSKYISSIIALFCLVIGFSCVSDPDIPSDMINAKIPEVKTLKIEDQKASSVTVSGEVVLENGMKVTEYGIYWSKGAAIDTTKAQRVSAGQGKGVFTVTIEGLDNNSEYHIAAYAINKKGIGLGEELIANTTPGLGSVSTLDPQNITATSVDVSGNIDLPGEGNINARGFYLSLTPEFTEQDTVLSLMQTDSFAYHITHLIPNTRYYVKAFVRNTFGTFSGSEKSFITTSGLPVISSLTKVDIHFYDATFKAKVVSEGDSAVTERGLCWKVDATPTIEDDTVFCGTGSGVFEGKIKNLQPQVRYHVRAFAKNAFGISYTNDTIFSPKSDFPSVTIDPTIKKGKGYIEISGNVLDEGQSAVIESGICWSTTSATPDSTDHKSSVSSGIGQFVGKIENMKANTTYYVRTYAKNSNKIAYSEDVVKFVTPDAYREVKAFNQDRIQGTVSFFHTEIAGFLLGGDKGPAYTNELWRYNIALGEWSQRKSYPEPDAIMGQASVVIGTNVFVFGGKNAVTNEYVNYLYSYETYSNTWLPLKSLPDTPEPVAFAAGCQIGQSAYYIGGLRSNSVSSEVEQYNSLYNIWLTQKRTNIPEAQYGGVAQTIDDVIYVGIGVSDMAGLVNNKKLWMSRDFGDSWLDCSPIPDEASKIIGGVAFQKNIYVVDNTGQIWKYSTNEDKWSKKTRFTTLENNIHCIYLLDDEIYIGLGSGTSQFIAYSPYWDN